MENHHVIIIHHSLFLLVIKHHMMILHNFLFDYLWWLSSIWWFSIIWCLSIIWWLSIIWCFSIMIDRWCGCSSKGLPASEGPDRRVCRSHSQFLCQQILWVSIIRCNIHIALLGSCNGGIRLGIFHFKHHFKHKCHFHSLINWVLLKPSLYKIEK